MRKTATLLVGAALVGVFAANAFAGSLLTEAFTYADGPLVANSGGNWTTHSGAGTDIAVATGAAVGLMSNSPDDNRLLTSARTATEKTYACFTLTVPSQPAAGLIANYFAHFMVNGTTFRSKVFIAASGGSYTVGVSPTANASGAPLAIPAAPLGATWGSALNFGQAYRIAISYEPIAGTSQLWVDPVNEASTSISATDAVAVNGALTAFGFRQSSTGGCAYTYTVDDLSVGTSFADACGGVVGVENSTWSAMKSIYR